MLTPTLRPVAIVAVLWVGTSVFGGSSCAPAVPGSSDEQTDPGGGTKADEAGVADQASSDLTVLRAEALDPIGGYGQPGFRDEECTPVDDLSMDCTLAFEARFGAPALHPIVIARGSSQFFCRLLRVETVTRAAASQNSDGVGFYYRGYGQNGLRFLERQRLVSRGEVTLKGGELAERHEFVGLANCWLGSASSSSQATYEFKPFLRFTAPDTGIRYRNWDQADSNYRLSTRNDRFDRSAELLLQ